jgi:hypothetical protein
MKQVHIDKIKKLVADDGIDHTLTIFGGDKDIVRKAYIDNPISFMDMYIGKLTPCQFNSYTYWYNHNIEIIIVQFKDSPDVIYIYDFIWNHFYKSIMKFDDNKIELLLLQWLYKHYPSLSMIKLKPIDDVKFFNRRLNLLIGD